MTESQRVWLVFGILTAILALWFRSCLQEEKPKPRLRNETVFQTKAEKKEYQRLLAYHGLEHQFVVMWQEHGVWHFTNRDNQNCHFVWPKGERHG